MYTLWYNVHMYLPKYVQSAVRIDSSLIVSSNAYMTRILASILQLFHLAFYLETSHQFCYDFSS